MFLGISSFTQFTEPGKVMEYLSSGLPVVVTKVPRIAFEIDNHRAGFAIEYDKEQLVVAILKLLTDSLLLKEYRENALQLALEYDWTVILNKAWSESTVLFRENNRSPDNIIRGDRGLKQFVGKGLW